MSDTIQEKCEQAVAKKHSGYNCAQAVACTFCEEAGLDDETMRNYRRTGRSALPGH